MNDDSSLSGKPSGKLSRCVSIRWNSKEIVPTTRSAGFCLIYLTSVDRITMPPFSFHGHGTYWFMYAKDGDQSYSRLHSVSISEFSAETELLSARV